ncbi:hypothetical protein [Candidatus Erwinia haradaeae]|uniref:hypothetical protein n=1 Tax=Candidatus Erwinia haradaeae TaxID=1922217 RepID=UPI00130063C1|nr:hypothetical protein [Candidatus Erwinia haradaeae]
MRTAHGNFLILFKKLGAHLVGCGVVISILIENKSIQGILMVIIIDELYKILNAL